MPKISTIIPIYNAGKYLRECLDSVANQTLNDIEIICVNDGSTDESLAILEEYAQKDKRINIINQDNAGAGTARNKGIIEASGEYVHFLDADDYLVLDAYEVLYNKAKEYDLNMLKAKVYAVDANTLKIIINPWYTLSPLSTEDFNKVTNFYKLPKNFLRLLASPWNGIYKLSFLKSNGLFFNNLKCVNDRSFYVSVLINSRAIMFLDYFMMYYRVNTPNSLISLRARYFHCHFESYEVIRNMCTYLSPYIKYLILENELNDMFVWYRKYQNENSLKKEIGEQTRIFINNIDMSVFKYKLKQCRWYHDYCDLTGKHKGGVILKIRSLFCRTLICYQEHGLKFTTGLAIKKIYGMLVKIGD